MREYVHMVGKVWGWRWPREGDGGTKREVPTGQKGGKENETADAQRLKADPPHKAIRRTKHD